MRDNMSLVEHVNRNKNGLTKMQIQIPISMRAGMAELSKRLGISQLALVRSALAAFLVANEAPVAPLVAPKVIAEAQPEEATEAQPEAQPEAQAEETTEAQPEAQAEETTKAQAEEPTEAQPEAQTPAPPPQAATEANAARAARHRSKLLSRKPTETRKPRTKQANS